MLRIHDQDRRLRTDNTQKLLVFALAINLMIPKAATPPEGFNRPR